MIRTRSYTSRRPGITRIWGVWKSGCCRCRRSFHSPANLRYKFFVSELVNGFSNTEWVGTSCIVPFKRVVLASETNGLRRLTFGARNRWGFSASHFVTFFSGNISFPFLSLPIGICIWTPANIISFISSGSEESQLNTSSLSGPVSVISSPANTAGQFEVC